MKRLLLFFLLTLVSALPACGHKGDLYLPSAQPPQEIPQSGDEDETPKR